MKRIFCLILAMVSICAAVSFVACENGKCDECKTKEDVKVYENSEGEKYELCPDCYAEKVMDNFLGGLLD